MREQEEHIEDKNISTEPFTKLEVSILKQLHNNFSKGEIETLVQQSPNTYSNVGKRFISLLKLYGITPGNDVVELTRASKYAKWALDNWTEDGDYGNIKNPIKVPLKWYDIDMSESGSQVEYRTGGAEVLGFDYDDAEDRAQFDLYSWGGSMETVDYGDWYSDDIEIEDNRFMRVDETIKTVNTIVENIVKEGNKPTPMSVMNKYMEFKVLPDTIMGGDRGNTEVEVERIVFDHISVKEDGGLDIMVSIYAFINDYGVQTPLTSFVDVGRYISDDVSADIFELLVDPNTYKILGYDFEPGNVDIDIHVYHPQEYKEELDEDLESWSYDGNEIGVVKESVEKRELNPEVIDGDTIMLIDDNTGSGFPLFQKERVYRHNRWYPGGYLFIQDESQLNNNLELPITKVQDSYTDPFEYRTTDEIVWVKVDEPKKELDEYCPMGKPNKCTEVDYNNLPDMVNEQFDEYNTTDKATRVRDDVFRFLSQRFYLVRREDGDLTDTKGRKYKIIMGSNPTEDITISTLIDPITDFMRDGMEMGEFDGEDVDTAIKGITNWISLEMNQEDTLPN